MLQVEASCLTSTTAHTRILRLKVDNIYCDDDNNYNQNSNMKQEEPPNNICTRRRKSDIGRRGVDGPVQLRNSGMLLKAHIH